MIPVQDVTSLNKKIDGKKNITYEVEIDKISAPITKGTSVGKLHIKENENTIRTIDITVKENVEKANVFDLYFNLESPCSTLYCTNRNRRCFSLRDILRCDEYQRTNVYRIFRRVQ